MAAETAQLVLPIGVVTRSDAGRLSREVESVDNFLRQGAIRTPGTPLQLPKTSRLFEETVVLNKLNMLQDADRQLLYQFLQKVRTEAPTLHISFNTDPSPLFTQRLITWIRQNMHPYLFLQIGLHPSIGAGCVVRTTNKFYDFSLRSRFSEQRQLLISKITGGEITPMAQPMEQLPQQAAQTTVQPTQSSELATPTPQAVETPAPASPGASA